MQARLTVPFADSSAGQLTWVLSPAAAPALASISVVVGRAVLRLSVLGASHQVDARLAGSAWCVESVTCEGGGLSPLPDLVERDLGGLQYRFESSVARLSEQGFATRARELRRRLAADRRALVASFPGHPDAVTALAAAAHRDGVGWRTWHAYPATRELVRTTTRLVRL